MDARARARHRNGRHARGEGERARHGGTVDARPRRVTTMTMDDDDDDDHDDDDDRPTTDGRADAWGRVRGVSTLTSSLTDTYLALCNTFQMSDL